MLAPTYTLQTHRHRFALWTAGRAVARDFCAGQHVSDAIQSSGLRETVEAETHFADQAAFDQWHLDICNRILRHWQGCAEGVKGPSFGRAAKVVAIYLKTNVGLQAEGAHPMQAYLHPPIDRILLDKMRQQLGYTIAKLPKWTQLDESRYTTVLDKIKVWMKLNRPDRPLWEVEEFWETV